MEDLTSDDKGSTYHASHSLLLFGVKINGPLRLPMKVSITNPEHKGPEDEENLPFMLSPHSEEEIEGEDEGIKYYENHKAARTTIFPNGTLARNLPEYCCLPAGELVKNILDPNSSRYMIQDLDPLSRICFLSKAELIGVGIDFHDRSASLPIHEGRLVEMLQERDKISGMINEFGFRTIPSDLRLFDANIEVVYHVPNYESGRSNHNNSKVINASG